MSGMFDVDGGLMGTLGKITDVIILSVLFLVFSIPIVTMGASFTALYYTAVKCIRRGRGYIFKSFWKSFRENFKNGTILWLIMLIIVSLLALNFRFCSQVIGGTTGLVFSCIYGMMAFTFLLFGIYIFPLLSRFNISKKKIISNGFLMAIKHLPYSFLMVIFVVVSIWATTLIPPLIIILPAGGALLLSLPMERILKKYTPASGDGKTDEWYLE
ncbi:MAG: YesL family protein [Acetivibrio sp.]